MMRTAIFTICSRNYLAYALTLQKSLQKAEPETPFFIYLADDAPEPDMATAATIVPVRDLGLPDLLDMAFRYTVMEFNTAIKADCILDLLENRGFEAAIYLDPDIQVFSPLQEVHTALQAGASLVVTPHILQPLPEGAVPSELDILRSGAFNLGFGAFAKTDESLAFIRWWAGKLHSDCYSAPEQGLFVDQRFVDMAPAFIEHLNIIRHPGYNVAYWNIAGRHVTGSGENIYVNETPLVFFHFSGVVPGRPDIFSKHLGEASQAMNRCVAALVRAYLQEIEANGHAIWSRVPYAFERFRDGSQILAPMRRNPPATGSAMDWFSAPDLEYWNGPAFGVEADGDIVITRLMKAILDTRPDLKSAFDLSTVAGRRGHYAWFHRHGVREYGIPDSLKGVPPRQDASASLARLLFRLRIKFADMLYGR